MHIQNTATTRGRRGMTSCQHNYGSTIRVGVTESEAVRNHYCSKGLYALRFANTNKRDGHSRLRLVVHLRRPVIRQVRDGAVDSDFLVWELAWELESVKCSCRRSMLAKLRCSTGTALSATRADDLGQRYSALPVSTRQSHTNNPQTRLCSTEPNSRCTPKQRGMHDLQPWG